MNKLKPAWLQKVDVQANMTREILRKSLLNTESSKYIPSTEACVLRCTQWMCTSWDVLSTYQYIRASMVYYSGTPEHRSTVEHGNKGRVTNPSLAGDVEITVSQCNRIYLIMVVLHIRRARMQTDFLSTVCTEYVPVCARYGPRELGKRCYLSFSTAQSFPPAQCSIAMTFFNSAVVHLWEYVL